MIATTRNIALLILSVISDHAMSFEIKHTLSIIQAQIGKTSSIWSSSLIYPYAYKKSVSTIHLLSKSSAFRNNNQINYCGWSSSISRVCVHVRTCVGECVGGHIHVWACLCVINHNVRAETRMQHLRTSMELLRTKK